jgi:carbon storage regulator
MLVLSRKAGQEIIIGRNVSIRVLEINGNRIRVGITAPIATPIRRQELCRDIDLPTEARRGNAAAANVRSENDEAVQ